MATAVVNKITISNKDFDPPVEETRHIVNKCSSLEEHNHEGDAAGILSEIILLEMAEKVEVKGGAKNPPLLKNSTYLHLKIVRSNLF